MYYILMLTLKMLRQYIKLYILQEKDSIVMDMTYEEGARNG